MEELLDLVKISRYAGQRIDLVQAGGGNSSVKTSGGLMIIKASGFLLSEVTTEKGFSELSLPSLMGVFADNSIKSSSSQREREFLSTEWVKKAQFKGEKPSIETTFHAILNKYVLHTHPMVVNMIVCREGWKQQLSDIFPDNKICFIDYRTPGIDLALELEKKINDCGVIPPVTFLQNHGLIVSSDKLEDIFELTEKIVCRLEDSIGIDFGYCRNSQLLGNVLFDQFGMDDLVYRVEDQWLNQVFVEFPELFFMPPITPDVVVFCGSGAVKMQEVYDFEQIEKYRNQFGVFPKVLIFREQIFLVASSLRKARESEEVLKFTIQVLKQNRNLKLNFLSEEEILYLNNWEAEKYRQKI
jgi:rhamnose utilization protein RhaD (predicted bifunctional aldolase and dehydrogenase)